MPDFDFSSIDFVFRSIISILNRLKNVPRQNMVDETDYEKFQKWTLSMGAGWAVWTIFFSVFFLRKKNQGEEEIISVFWLQHYGNERKEVKYSSAFWLLINKTIDRQRVFSEGRGSRTSFLRAIIYIEEFLWFRDTQSIIHHLRTVCW